MIKCYECRQCNNKGKPSTMRGSAYCDNNRINKKIIRMNIFEKIKDKMFNLLYDEKTNKIRNKGGFRFK